MKTAKLFTILLATALIAFAFFLGSCTKSEQPEPGNKYRLYNDPNNETYMVIGATQISFWKNGNHITTVQDNDLLSGDFIMPLVWDYKNPDKVGYWISECEYLRYYYIGLDGNTYRMDWVNEKYLN